MSEFIPTTEQVREAYVDGLWDNFPELRAGEIGFIVDEFDRWLAQHDAEIAKATEERIIALLEEACHGSDEPENPCSCDAPTYKQVDYMVALIKGDGLD